MTPDNGTDLPDYVRTAIRTRHPDLADEIRDAIDTLRKLHELAAPNQQSPVDANALATSDGSSPPTPLKQGLALAESLATTASSVLPAGTDEVLQTTDSEFPGPAPPRQARLLSANETFGRYQIVRPLGRGAMGAVYLAYDSQLQRHVALKTPSLSDRADVIARFLSEARAAAQLRSPYICPVYDVGEIGGIRYLSMAFIDGAPLSRLITEGRLRTPEAIAAMTQKIARGLQKAHEQGVIHRDLKPDNIMIDGDGEPIVMDFGLARRLDDDVRLTNPGSLMGTPAYMSPEQVEGDPDRIGPGTDIYSLGVMLFEMLTGRLPFQGSLAAILRQITLADPPKPSSLNPALAQAERLEHVCLRMMARSQTNRYPNMAAVVTALDEAFAPETGPAPAPSLLARLRAWMGGLFSTKPQPQPAVALPAVAPPEPMPVRAEENPERTLAGSGSVSPVRDEHAQSAEMMTIDI
jgi:serine/threonine protein kinase